MQQSTPPPLRAPQSAAPKLPTILIQDLTQSPEITTHYLCQNNALDFCSIYTSTKSLLTHLPCPHNPTWPCAACETAFLTTYWTAAAHLLDYFADFAHLDTPLMQSLWFHLLDIWQESAAWMPCEEILMNARVSPGSMRVFSKARWFLEEWKATIELMDLTIHGVKGGNIGIREAIIHLPTGEKRSPAGEYNTGPWISGLSGWRQWLSEGSPGVAAPIQPEETEERKVTHVPMPAIAIVKAHTERARRIAAQINPDPEFLNAFDQNSLRFPSTNGASHTYHSLTGRAVTYQLSNGVPPVSRYYGYGDPSMFCSQQDFNLLDECVAVCRGVEAYEPVSGAQGEGQSDVDEESFDVWTVFQSKDMQGEKNGLIEGWEDMFDEWVGDEEA